jgi:hypothetical protein
MTRLASRRVQRLTHCFWLARDDLKICTRGLVRFDAVLFPIAQRAEWNVIARREIFLT